MQRQPVEERPDRWQGGYAGHHVSQREPIPVVVRVHWTEGTESHHAGSTKQWTRSHVRVQFNGQLPDLWVRADQCKRA